MLRASLLTILGLVLFQAAAPAQPPKPPPGPPPGSHVHFLLHQKPVQDDLKLTQQQFSKIQEQIFRDMQQVKQLKASLPPEQFKEKMHELFKEKDKNVLALLQASQQKRLKQIMLQVQVPRVFTDRTVAKELKLDDEQQQQMSTIMDTATRDQQILFESKPQPAVMQKKMAELKKKATEQTLAVLTSEQRSQWSEMIGTAFKGQIQLPPPGEICPPPPPMPSPLPPATHCKRKYKRVLVYSFACVADSSSFF